MSKISELDNLCGPGKPLRQEPVDARECENLVLSGGWPGHQRSAGG